MPIQAAVCDALNLINSLVSLTVRHYCFSRWTKKNKINKSWMVLAQPERNLSDLWPAWDIISNLISDYTLSKYIFLVNCNIAFQYKNRMKDGWTNTRGSVHSLQLYLGDNIQDGQTFETRWIGTLLLYMKSIILQWKITTNFSIFVA